MNLDWGIISNTKPDQGYSQTTYEGGGGVTHCTLSYLFTFLPSILSASSESGAYFAGVSLSPGILRREEMAAFRLPSIFFPYVIKIICTGNTFNTF